MAEANQVVALKTPGQKKEKQQAPGFCCGSPCTWSFGVAGAARWTCRLSGGHMPALSQPPCRTSPRRTSLRSHTGWGALGTGSSAGVFRREHGTWAFPSTGKSTLYLEGGQTAAQMPRGVLSPLSVFGDTQNSAGGALSIPPSLTCWEWEVGLGTARGAPTSAMRKPDLGHFAPHRVSLFADSMDLGLLTESCMDSAQLCTLTGISTFFLREQLCSPL